MNEGDLDVTWMLKKGGRCPLMNKSIEVEEGDLDVEGGWSRSTYEQLKIWTKAILML